MANRIRDQDLVRVTDLEATVLDTETVIIDVNISQSSKKRIRFRFKKNLFFFDLFEDVLCCNLKFFK